MSGHSHWATIKFKKRAADAKRGRLFGKLARAIMIAARNGDDPETNIRLRAAVQDAKDVSMPKENIERAIKKGAGKLEGAELTEVTYEGYGPSGVAIMVQTVTDNTSRTLPQVRGIFEHRGGKLAGAGSTAWMFKRKGLVAIKRDAVDEDTLLEIVLDAGADDLTDAGSVWEIICGPDSLYSVTQAIANAEIEVESSQITLIADSEITPDIETQVKNLRLMSDLEDNDDVQNVYANFSPSEEAVAQIG